MASAGRRDGGRRFLAVVFQPRCGLGCVGAVFLWELWAWHAGLVGRGSFEEAARGGAAVPDDGGAGAGGIDARFQEQDCGRAECGVRVDAAGTSQGWFDCRMGAGELAGEEFVFDFSRALSGLPADKRSIYALCVYRAGATDDRDRVCLGDEPSCWGGILPLG